MSNINEVSPPGWSGTVKAMKRHSDKIDNPFALAWSMRNKGDKPHYKPEPKDTSKSDKEPEKKEKYKNEGVQMRTFQEFLAEKGEVIDEKNWIQKAVNPKHKGWCTPLSNPNCKGRRRALAKRFKHGDIHHDNTDS